MFLLSGPPGMDGQVPLLPHLAAPECTEPRLPEQLPLRDGGAEQGFRGEQQRAGAEPQG